MPASTPSATPARSSFFMTWFLPLNSCLRLVMAPPRRPRPAPLLLSTNRGPPPEDVDIDGDDDDQADQDLRPEGADIVDVEPVAQDAHDEHARQHAEPRAAPAEKTRPADDHRRDGIELDADAGI